MTICRDNCNSSEDEPNDSPYRMVLWGCLITNGAMFFLQTIGSYQAISVSLLANALDFLSDGVNYGISLFVLRKSLNTKAKASMVKGISLGAVGLWVAFETLRHAIAPSELPKPEIMSLIGLLGLAVNIGCAIALYRFRTGDSNRASVWICSRNDAIGNIAVMLAAAGVYASQTAWPDIIVASILGYLALSGATQIVMHARKELQATKPGDA